MNAPRTGREERLRAIRELIARQPVSSQAQLVRELAGRGIGATQATVSRDIAELGLVKVARAGRHVYLAPEDLAPSRPDNDDRLRRILADIPVTVGRSGLILVLTGSAGTANAIAQAIDESSLHEQEGTVAGDNTLIVLFADAERLERWLARFRTLQGLPLPDGGQARAAGAPEQELDA